MWFARKFGDKHGNKLMDTATKTGIGAAKNASKRLVQKTAEATGDLIGNKIANEITSIGTTKEKPKKKEEIYIPPEKRQQIIDTRNVIVSKYNCKKLQICLIRLSMIKIYQDLLPKNGSKFMINQEKIATLTKKLELKHQF